MDETCADCAKLREDYDPFEPACTLKDIPSCGQCAVFTEMPRSNADSGDNKSLESSQLSADENRKEDYDTGTVDVKPCRKRRKEEGHGDARHCQFFSTVTDFLTTRAGDGQLFGRRRECSGKAVRSMGDAFIGAVEYFCRRGRKKGKGGTGDGDDLCEVHVILQKYSEKRGWMAVQFGTHNHIALSRNERSQRYKWTMKAALDDDRAMEARCMAF